MDFEKVADELYAVVPSEFVAARRTAVTSAKEAGNKGLAKELGSLKKPTTTGWALNVLVRSEPDAVVELLDLGAQLRSAQQALRGDELRTLSNRRSTLLSMLTDRAASAARSRGHELPGSVLRDVGQSLAAALADEEIGADLRRGRMLGAVSYSGFGPASLAAVPEQPHETATGPDPVPPSEDDAAHRVAQRRLTDARRAAHEAVADLEASTERAEQANRTVARLRDELSLAEQECRFAESARRSAEEAARIAADELTRAQELAAE